MKTAALNSVCQQVYTHDRHGADYSVRCIKFSTAKWIILNIYQQLRLSALTDLNFLNFV